MAHKKKKSKKIAGVTLPRVFKPSKYHKTKPKTPKQTLQNVQSAIVVALKLLKPVVNRKLPKAHFNFEREEKKEEKKEHS